MKKLHWNLKKNLFYGFIFICLTSAVGSVVFLYFNKKSNMTLKPNLPEKPEFSPKFKNDSNEFFQLKNQIIVFEKFVKNELKNVQEIQIYYDKNNIQTVVSNLFYNNEIFKTIGSNKLLNYYFWEKVLNYNFNILSSFNDQEIEQAKIIIKSYQIQFNYFLNWYSKKLIFFNKYFKNLHFQNLIDKFNEINKIFQINDFNFWKSLNLQQNEQWYLNFWETLLKIKYLDIFEIHTHKSFLNFINFKKDNLLTMNNFIKKNNLELIKINFDNLSNENLIYLKNTLTKIDNLKANFEKNIKNFLQNQISYMQLIFQIDTFNSQINFLDKIQKDEFNFLKNLGISNQKQEKITILINDLKNEIINNKNIFLNKNKYLFKKYEQHLQKYKFSW
ncbi:hypothetical protein [Mycoplasmopsis cricetuli]|uniref:hypothetical protein n=1 Tax=Mycoplasmopsis cricetuli TaxID=171283 RepID=UPI0004705388|nr:hypothetical protein [Mycoplasmopsis cricetuli]